METLETLFKIFLLSVSFILAFIEKDFIFIGGMTFGGKISVMMLALIEIVETFVDMKKISIKNEKKFSGKNKVYKNK